MSDQLTPLENALAWIVGLTIGVAIVAVWSLLSATIVWLGWNWVLVPSAHIAPQPFWHIWLALVCVGIIVRKLRGK